MSTTDKPANVGSQKTRDWPDMSAYGIHFGVVDMPRNERRLVMVDETGSWTALARQLGFLPTRWVGIWAKSSLNVSIPGFKTQFPRAKKVQLTDAEIREAIKKQIIARKDMRRSQMPAQPGAGRLSWHPTKTTRIARRTLADAVSAAVGAGAAEDEDSSISAATALRQTLFLGLNHLGQEVFEAGDGQRFAKSADAIVAREGAGGAPSPAFLRASNENDLVMVAAGMVAEIDAGKTLRSEDFVRFMEAVYGTDSAEDKELVGKFHAAIDQALRERVAKIPGTGREAFNEALRLHEGRPSFWRAAGTLCTPLPIAAVMQTIADTALQARAAGEPPVIIDITPQTKSNSWALSATSVSGGELPTHDVMLAGIFNQPVREHNVMGVRVSRTDSEMLLGGLAKRRDDGITVLLTTTDKAGKLDQESRRVIAAVGQHYEVLGYTDIDTAMFGPGNEKPSRLIVIGAKRASPDYTFAAFTNDSVIYDYESLWSWVEVLKAIRGGEEATFGDDGREENRWQAPYIPSSQVSEPEAMSPRNLLGPVRKALANIIERHGMGIDEFVASKIGWTIEEMSEYLAAEQVDAVALGILALDEGRGLVEADATGLGKGRACAALALYAKRQGKNVLFLTEKADLFSDFFRDIADIGATEDMRNVFVMNNDHIVRDGDGNEIARSPKRVAATEVLAAGEFPKCDFAMATYSQFNRQYDPTKAKPRERSEAARTVQALVAGAVDEMEALAAVGPLLKLYDYRGNGITTLDGAANYEAALAAKFAAGGDDEKHAAKWHARLAAAYKHGKKGVVELLSKEISSDMITLKHQWLHSDALKGAVVIMDESHNAAGDTSQTGVNLRAVADKAGALVFSSATYAKDTKNFTLYSRVFPQSLRAATIGDTLERGGEPMQEIVSVMLAEDGRMIRREHDLSNLEFRVTTDVARKERNEEWGNAFARVLAAMSYLSGEVENLVIGMNEDAEDALAQSKQSGTSGTKIGVQYTNFSSRLYNLSRTFTMAANADQVVELAVKDLQEGRKPVIAVENTMETVLREMVNGIDLEAQFDGDEAQADPAAAQPQADPLPTVGAIAALDPMSGAGGDDMFSSPSSGSAAPAAVTAAAKKRASWTALELGRRVSFKDILRSYADSVYYATEVTRVDGKITAKKRLNLKNPVIEEGVKAIYGLIDEMPEIPVSPLDIVRDGIAAAGYSIDEISGRTLCLQTGPNGNHVIARLSPRSKAEIKRDFNAGVTDAVLLSRAGSTGISLHASRKFADQSQRVMIELQPAADIASRLQFWGRINRKGQVCSPIIHMVSSGLPSEMRLIAMQNAKLRRMSANISGNADNSAINEDAPDILNKIGNEVCYRWMEANPKISSILGYQVGEIDEDKARSTGTKFVDMLTGRLMMLDVATQRRVYDEITLEFRALIEQFELEGRNPLKSAEYDVRAKRLQTKIVQVAAGADSVFDEAVHATEIEYAVETPVLARAALEEMAAAGRKELEDALGAKYAQDIAADMVARTEAHLSLMLAKRYATIEEALNDKGPNAVKAAKFKAQWMAAWLHKLVPGSIVSFGTFNEKTAKYSKDNWDGWCERVYITGWELPKTKGLSLAEYRLIGYSERTRRKTRISLSSIIGQPHTWIDADFVNDRPVMYEAGAAEFFRKTAVPEKGALTRTILEGNLYRAAELAAAENTGQAITYSDEKGTWHHSILMPRNFSLNHALTLPVVVNDAEMLLSAITNVDLQRKQLQVADDFRLLQEKQVAASYKLYAMEGRLHVQFFGKPDKVAWLEKDPDVLACVVNGEFKGTRQTRSGNVIAGKETEFCEAFMKAARCGARVLLPGWSRDWANSYLEAKTKAAEAPCATVAEALESEDELASLLAATP